LRHVEDQDDGPVGVAFVMILALRDDERLLLAGRSEKQHVAFHRQTFDGRQRKERILIATRHEFFDLAGCCFSPFDVQLDVAHSVLRTRGARGLGELG
jgi:hypothetical protein